MALKKSELYSTIWKSCDELRGGMDASQYKDYVLVLLFIKYVSDKKKYDRNALVEIPEGSGFDAMLALRGDAEIGDKINKEVIAPLAKANGLTGVIDQTDFNDEDKLGKGKEMVDRLTNLINIFNAPGLDFGKNKAEGDDLLGDAYEYLMRHFATESGKSKGQFYTPAEVSRIMAQIINVRGAQSSSQTVYDPTCGSGSLLLKVAEEAPDSIHLTIYGQEKDNATKGLSIMNMWMHGYETADIHQGDTLASPFFKNSDGSLKTFDWVVANPPFSTKSWSNGFDPQNDLYDRFKGIGIPPTKNGDYAFLLHILKSLKSTGTGAIILPHGVLFRGNVEAQIRENLIRRRYIKGIIGLPANLFYGTGIPACIIVVDKEGASVRKGVFMIDASKGYIKDGNKNRLREQDIHRIVDVFNNQLPVSKYSRMVLFDEIESNEYNLNIPRYIDSQEAEDIHDIEAHLKGGIPKYDIDDLQDYWDVYPDLRQALFSNSVRDKYYDLRVEEGEIKSTIFNHPEFQAFQERARIIFQNWSEKHLELLENIDNETIPKELIRTISEALLHDYKQLRLVDPYNMYQHLMNYWNEAMKDDVYILIEEGWKATLSPVTDNKGKARKGEFDSDLVPKELVINRYFDNELKQIEELEQSLEEASSQMQEMIEEHGGDEGLITDVINDKGKVTKGDLTKRMKEIKGNHQDQDEMNILEQYKIFMDTESGLKKKIKEAAHSLDKMVYIQYPKLSQDDVRSLVVHDKWLLNIKQDLMGELDRVSQKMTSRINELSIRYQTRLSDLSEELLGCTNKVNEHLEKMGVL